MDNNCPCCQPWKWKRTPSGAIALAASIDPLSVYNVDGELRWSVNAIRHATGTFQRLQGCCFGPDQAVYVGQIDFHAFPTPHDYYVYKYDSAGNFISETVAGRFSDTSRRVLVSNINGQVVIVSLRSVTGYDAQILGGASCVMASGTTLGPVATDINNDVYVLNTGEFGTTLEVDRFDSFGAFIERLDSTMTPTSGTGFAMDVAQDGSYLWVAKSILDGATHDTTFKQLEIPGGTVLSTATTNNTATAISAIRIAPWGTRYDAFNSTEIGAETVNSLKILNDVGALSVGFSTMLNVTLNPLPGGPYQGVAVSID